MKKLILIFALLFTVSSSFISCRETAREEDDLEEVGDDLEDVGDDIEDEVDEMGDDM